MQASSSIGCYCGCCRSPKSLCLACACKRFYLSDSSCSTVWLLFNYKSFKHKFPFINHRNIRQLKNIRSGRFIWQLEIGCRRSEWKVLHVLCTVSVVLSKHCRLQRRRRKRMRFRCLRSSGWFWWAQANGMQFDIQWNVSFDDDWFTENWSFQFRILTERKYAQCAYDLMHNRTTEKTLVNKSREGFWTRQRSTVCKNV